MHHRRGRSRGGRGWRRTHVHRVHTAGGRPDDWIGEPGVRIRQCWPEFAAAGKKHVTVRQLLSHQAGLLNVDGGFSLDELLGHEKLAGRLAAQRPVSYPGEARGYHALTIVSDGGNFYVRTRDPFGECSG
ncbi:MAG: beta-lactamase family protein [Chloroflexi bacterium]|nr:beta-lactamase family protein [Chloroflexota bacterium]